MSTAINIRSISARGTLQLRTDANVSVSDVLSNVIAPMFAAGQLPGAVEFQVFCPEAPNGLLTPEHLTNAANEDKDIEPATKPWQYGDRAPRSNAPDLPVPPPAKVVRKLSLVPA